MPEAKAFDPAALLQQKAADVKPPVRLPVGSFVATILSREYTKVGEKQNTVCQYKVRYDEALPDVNADDLARAIDTAEGGRPMNEVEDKLDFWITPDALWRIVEFHNDHLRLDPELPISEQVEAAPGHQFIAVRSQVANKKDPTKPYINITATAALPE